MVKLVAGAACWSTPERPLKKHRLYSPGAVAAMAAVEGLTGLTPDLAVVAVTTALGPMVAAFDKAWQAAAGGPLVGPGFAQTRARRIHPFTLLKALDNQVPACLARELRLLGPCRHFHDSVDLWPVVALNLRDLAEQRGRVLLVAVHVRHGDEEETKRRYCAQTLAVPEKEGAVALMFEAGEAPMLPAAAGEYVFSHAAALWQTFLPPARANC